MLHIFEGKKHDQMTQALEDLEKLQPYVDAVIVENYGCGYFDSNNATKETGTRLLEIIWAVMEKATIPVGINVLPNDYEKAFCIASRSGAKFVQLDHVTGDFVGARSVNPKKLLSVRRRYPKIALLGGIHPKYYKLLNPCTSIGESAINAKTLADAVVVTGEYTGGAARIEDLQIVKRMIEGHPLVIGSGLTAENAKMQLSIADGAIVGTAFKRKGVCAGEPVDMELVKQLMHEVNKLR